MTRTDIHAPASADFDPAAYVLVGVFDTHPEAGEGRARSQAIGRMKAMGYAFAQHVGQMHVCGHCGAHLRYVALMARQDVMELIYVGQDCLDNRFEALTKGEFDALRKAASLNRERTKKADKIAAEIAIHPVLGELLDAYDAGELSGFLCDIAMKFRQYGNLSDRQIDAAERVLVEQRARAAAKAKAAAEKAQAIEEGTIEPAPTGRVIVTGKVLSTKWVEGYVGGSTMKMRLRDDRGFTVWLTVPASIVDDVEQGVRVTLTATLTPAEGDAHHAWGAKPTKASVAA